MKDKKLKKHHDAADTTVKVEKKNVETKDSAPVTAPIKKKKDKAPTTIDPEKVKKVKKASKEKAERKAAPPPPKIPLAIGDIKNPLIESKHNKRALAIALAKVVKSHNEGADDKTIKTKLANFVRLSGIPFKQVETADMAEKADPLHKGEWSGKPYAGWAMFNIKSYEEANPERVKSCMAFAKALYAESKKA